LMRGGVQQLARWDLLETLREAGTPPIRTTTFHYGDEAIRLPIKPSAGVDALYAPRRTVLDVLLAEAAEAAGVEVRHGLSVVDLLRDGTGRVRGATIADTDRRTVDVSAELVIGADGIRSRVVRILDLELEHTLPHASASIYGYVRGLEQDGNHWYYAEGASVGAIPTNDDETCVFASVPRERFEAERGAGLEALHAAVLAEVSRDLAERVSVRGGPGKLRAFAGIPGFLRRAAGPGWALVGDAAYFRDPITAHGITDALREAEFVARAVLEGTDEALDRCAAARYDRVHGFFEVTDRIASFDWTLEEAKAHHLVLSKEMKRLADTQAEFEASAARVA
ncbi:MAG: NAD(P)/FAD-dependent oxidoreductase, partial [Gemmatimonadota bacterium]